MSTSSSMSDTVCRDGMEPSLSSLGDTWRLRAGTEGTADDDETVGAA